MERIKYIPGTYSAAAKGIGKVTAAVTVDKDTITKVDLDLSHETENVGQKTAKQLSAEILAKQSNEVDTITGASLTSNAVRLAVGQALEQAQGKEYQSNKALNDGTFSGTAQGHGGPLTVEITAQDNQITSAKVTKQTESPYVANKVMELIPQEIVAQQTLAVDAVSGATLTSSAITAAAGQAIKAAGGDEASWQLAPYLPRPAYNGADIKTDLLVVGAGISGLATAAFALKNGIKHVTILEKNEQVGGSFRYSAGGFALANTKKLHDQGFDDKVENPMNYVAGVNKGATNPQDLDFVKYLISRSGETFDQIGDMIRRKPLGLAQFSNIFLHGTYGLGAQTADWLKDYVVARGGQLILNAEITDLQVEDDQAVAVTASVKGKEFQITADNYVIAAGGTSYDHEALMDKVTPSLKNIDLFNEANVGNTGKGYDLLVKAGAATDGEDVYKNAFLDFDPALQINWSNEPDASKGILINADAKRFTNEAAYELSNLSTEAIKEGSPAYFEIFSEETIDPKLLARTKGLKQSPTIYVEAQNATELAKKLKLDPQALIQTLTDYNQNAQQGQDEFDKNPDDLVVMDPAQKLYAFYIMPGSWGTMGGVKINRQMQVERTDGSHFQNLFAVGEVSTGDLFTEYYLGGFSLSYYSTEGRLVAEYLAKKN